MGDIGKWDASKIVFQNVSVSEMPLKFLCFAKLSPKYTQKNLRRSLQPPVKFWWDIYTLDFLI
jgi:hypothetical protein